MAPTPEEDALRQIEHLCTTVVNNEYAAPGETQLAQDILEILEKVI